MNSLYTGNISLSIFGESHGKGVGVVIDGLPPGIELNLEVVQQEMNRRKPGGSSLTTPRKEDDGVDIISGFFEGRTTGSPLCGIIFSKDTKSGDYSELKDKMRPGHSDYSGNLHYRGYNDYRGGGHFSGRLTAPLVFAGAICKQYLQSRGIYIGAHIKEIHNICDRLLVADDFSSEVFGGLSKMALPVLDTAASEKMEKAILEAREMKDSVGGIVECMAIGVPGGIGNPFFNSFESIIGKLAFSIPGVKGISFGAGYDFSKMTGSEANDSFCMEDGSILTETNHNGGVLGGITTGMPVVFNVVMKPTPSIGKEQNTVSLNEMKNTTLEIKGRHDPCIVVRGVPVVESILAIGLMDMVMEDKKWN